MNASDTDRRGRLRRGFYRDPEKGVFLGVCAGIAEYFDIGIGAVRVITIVGLIFFFPATLLGYLALGMILRRAPREDYPSPEDERFWRRMRTGPGDAFSEIRHRYRTLEQRLRALESHVTSREYRVAREIDDLER